MNGAPLLRVVEVAKRLSISERSVWSLIAGGKIPVVRIGKSPRVDPADLEAFIVNHKVSGRREVSG